MGAGSLSRAWQMSTSMSQTTGADSGGWDYSCILERTLSGIVEAGQGIGLVFLTWTIGQREVEPCQEKGPPCLAQIQPPRYLYVLRVPMVG